MRSPSEQMEQALATGQDVMVHRDGSVELSGLKLLGLPDGLMVLRYGKVQFDGEYILRDNGGCLDMKGVVGFVVKMAPGYEMKYDIKLNRDVPVKTFPIPKMISVMLKATNSQEEAEIKSLSANPLFVGYVG